MRQPKFHQGQKVKAKDGKQVMTVHEILRSTIRETMPKAFAIAQGKIIGYEYKGEIQCNWTDVTTNTPRSAVFQEDYLEIVED